MWAEWKESLDQSETLISIFKSYPESFLTWCTPQVKSDQSLWATRHNFLVPWAWVFPSFRAHSLFKGQRAWLGRTPFPLCLFQQRKMSLLLAGLTCEITCAFKVLLAPEHLMAPHAQPQRVQSKGFHHQNTPNSCCDSVFSTQVTPKHFSLGKLCSGDLWGDHTPLSLQSCALQIPYLCQGCLCLCRVLLLQVWDHFFHLYPQAVQCCLLVPSCLQLLLVPLEAQVQQLMVPQSVCLDQLLPQLANLVLQTTDHLRERANKVTKPKPNSTKPTWFPPTGRQLG